MRSRSLDGLAVNVDPGSRLELEIVLGLGRGEWGESKLPEKKSTEPPFGCAQCGRGACASPKLELILPSLKAYRNESL